VEGVCYPTEAECDKSKVKNCTTASEFARTFMTMSPPITTVMDRKYIGGVCHRMLSDTSIYVAIMGSISVSGTNSKVMIYGME
jgi:hypothetical protein